MTIVKSFFIVICTVFFFSCNDIKKTTAPTEPTVNKIDTITNSLSKSQLILNETIEAHGGTLYDSAHYTFVFRENKYVFKNAGHNYQYSTIRLKDGKTIIDSLENGKFSRTVNGAMISLNEKDTKVAIGALNSVIYFATLPHKLNDKAVNTAYIGETTIESKNYQILEISFAKEGGGEDHDDEFYYWINGETKKIDYLAYNYSVNNGGVRFRSAYNTRVVGGITFQDYINFKAEVGTPLKDLPSLYEAEKLEELSRVKTERIINLNK